MKEKLPDASKATTQARADNAHQYLIDNNPLYATDVARGGTVRWDKPKQKKDKDGNILDPTWFIHIDHGAEKAFNVETRALIVEV